MSNAADAVSHVATAATRLDQSAASPIVYVLSSEDRDILVHFQITDKPHLMTREALIWSVWLALPVHSDYSLYQAREQVCRSIGRHLKASWIAVQNKDEQLFSLTLLGAQKLQNKQ